MFSEPGGKLIFRQFPARELQYRDHHFRFAGNDAITIQAQEDVHDLERDALIPIEIRMIPRKPEAIAGGEIGHVYIGFVIPSVERAGQGGLQQTLIPNAV